MPTFTKLPDAARAPFAARITEKFGLPYFRCRCGALVHPDQMWDLQPKGAPGLNRPDLHGTDRFRCDGCCQTWVWTGKVTVDELRAARGLKPARPGKRI